ADALRDARPAGTPMRPEPVGQSTDPLIAAAEAASQRAESDAPGNGAAAPGGNGAPRADSSPRPRRPQPTPVPARPADNGDDGLPRRVRQASLATELRDAPSGPPYPEPEIRERPPEQIRSMMTAFQRGSLRGRSDAERLDEQPDGPDQQPRDDGAR
ncbi:MAG: hypothetical protein ACRDT4_21220, partial [Micromonosporaceae bacterium]